MKTSSRRMRLLAGAMLVALPAALGGCGAVTSSQASGGGDGEFQVADYIQDRVDAGEPLRIAVSYINPSLPFAIPLKAGTEKAAEELGNVEASFIGPTDGDPGKQVAELETLITSKRVDGLAVASASNDALKPVIAKAVAAGIPVVSFTNSNPGSAQMSHIGPDMTAAGKLAGEAFADLNPDKAGKVVVFSLDTGAGWSRERFTGFQGAAEEAGWQVVGPINTGSEPGVAYNTVQSTMAGQADADAVASLDCCSFTAIGKWLNDSGKAGEMTAIGFDLLPSTVGYLKDGTFDLTVTQDPVKQTFESVRVLVELLEDGTPIPERIDTGGVVVTKDNVDDVPSEG